MPLLLLLLGGGASHFLSADPRLGNSPAAQCALTSGQDLAPDFHINEAAASPAACCALCSNRACCHAAVFLGGTCYLKFNGTLTNRTNAATTTCRPGAVKPGPCPGRPPPTPAPTPAPHIWHDYQPRGGPYLPPWPPTYDLGLSTVVMPNPNPTYMLAELKGWGIVQIDWSNFKDVWSRASPMNCTQMLDEQAAILAKAYPQQKVWLYRNAIIAEAWFEPVRAKLADPAYKRWFMPYGKHVANPHSPKCNKEGNTTKCSELWHDEIGLGSCTAHPYTCGSVGDFPAAEYVFDPRSMNVSVNGKTMIEWYIEDYVLMNGGQGNPNVHGYFFDDHWDNFTAADDRSVGPSEVDPAAVSDMGLSTTEVNDVRAAFETFMDAVYAAVRQSGRFAWQMFWNGDSSVYSHDGMEEVALTGLAPLVTKGNCSAQLRYFCSQAGQERIHSVAMVTSWTTGASRTDAQQDVANFLLIRGPFAWLGSGWGGGLPPRPAALDQDHGHPLDNCSETTVGSGIFTRTFSKSKVTMNCGTWTASFSSR